MKILLFRASLFSLVYPFKLFIWGEFANKMYTDQNTQIYRVSQKKYDQRLKGHSGPQKWTRNKNSNIFELCLIS